MWVRVQGCLGSRVWDQGLGNGLKGFAVGESGLTGS